MGMSFRDPETGDVYDWTEDYVPDEGELDSFVRDQRRIRKNAVEPIDYWGKLKEMGKSVLSGEAIPPVIKAPYAMATDFLGLAPRAVDTAAGIVTDKYAPQMVDAAEGNEAGQLIGRGIQNLWTGQPLMGETILQKVKRVAPDLDVPVPGVGSVPVGHIARAVDKASTIAGGFARDPNTYLFPQSKAANLLFAPGMVEQVAHGVEQGGPEGWTEALVGGLGLGMVGAHTFSAEPHGRPGTIDHAVMGDVPNLELGEIPPLDTTGVERGLSQSAIDQSVEGWREIPGQVREARAELARAQGVLDRLRMLPQEVQDQQIAEPVQRPGEPFIEPGSTNPPSEGELAVQSPVHGVQEGVQAGAPPEAAVPNDLSVEALLSEETPNLIDQPDLAEQATGQEPRAYARVTKPENLQTRAPFEREGLPPTKDELMSEYTRTPEYSDEQRADYERYGRTWLNEHAERSPITGRGHEFEIPETSEGKPKHVILNVDGERTVGVELNDDGTIAKTIKNEGVPSSDVDRVYGRVGELAQQGKINLNDTLLTPGGYNIRSRLMPDDYAVVNAQRAAEVNPHGLAEVAAYQPGTTKEGQKLTVPQVHEGVRQLIEDHEKSFFPEAQALRETMEHFTLEEPDLFTSRFGEPPAPSDTSLRDYRYDENRFLRPVEPLGERRAYRGEERPMDPELENGAEIGNTGGSVFNSAGTTDPAMHQRLAGQLEGLHNAIAEVHDQINAFMPEGSKTNFIGFDLDPDVYGWRGTESGNTAHNIVSSFDKVYRIFGDDINPRLLGNHIFGTIAHEAAHGIKEAHGIDHVNEIIKVYQRMDPQGLKKTIRNALDDRTMRAISDAYSESLKNWRKDLAPNVVERAHARAVDYFGDEEFSYQRRGGTDSGTGESGAGQRPAETVAGSEREAGPGLQAASKRGPTGAGTETVGGTEPGPGDTGTEGKPSAAGGGGPQPAGVEKPLVKSFAAFMEEKFGSKSASAKERALARAEWERIKADRKLEGLAKETGIPLEKLRDIPTLPKKKGEANSLEHWRRAILPVSENLTRVHPWLGKVFEKYVHDTEIPASRLLADTHELRKTLDKKETREVIDILDGAKQPETASSPKVKEAAEKYRGILDKIWSDAEAGGVVTPDQKRDSYFPHKFEGTWEKEPLRKAQRNKSKKLAADPHLEKGRRGDLAGYRRDLDVLDEYIVDAHKRISYVQNFGKNRKILKKFFDKNPVDPTTQKWIDRNIDRAFGKTERTPFDKGAAAVRHVQSLSDLGLAALYQPVQAVNTSIYAGIGKSAKAVIRMVKDYPKEMHDAIRSGALFPDLSQEIRQGAIGSKTGIKNRALHKFMWGINTADKLTRIHANTAGKIIVEGALKGDRGAIKDLAALGIKDLKDPEAFLKAGKALSDKALFKTGSLEIPGWTSSSYGKLAIQYSRFQYRHSLFVRDLFKEARQGNWRPLSRAVIAMGTTMQGMGELLSTTKAGLKEAANQASDGKFEPRKIWETAVGKPKQGKDETEWTDIFSNKKIPWNHPAYRALQNVMTWGGAGLFQAMIERAFRGRDPYRATTGMLLGPVGSSAADLSAALISSLKKRDWRPMAKVVTQKIPIMGYPLARKIKTKKTYNQSEQGGF